MSENVEINNRSLPVLLKNRHKTLKEELIMSIEYVDYTKMDDEDLTKCSKCGRKGLLEVNPKEHQDPNLNFPEKVCLHEEKIEDNPGEHLRTWIDWCEL